MPPLSHLQLSSPRTVTGCARSVPDIELTLEQVRLWYGFCVTGYVVMPEHVHLLISEPERATLALAVQMLKQNISRELREFTKDGRYWEQRYYDFNVWGECKRVEKLRYIHRNPVKRGLVERAEDWIWSSFATTFPEWKESLKLSRSGLLGDENFSGLAPQVIRRG